MNPTINRRQWLRYAGSGLLVAAMPALANQLARDRVFRVSACGDSEDTYGLGWVGSASDAVFSAPAAVLSDFRGHSVVQHPRHKGSVLMIARRPGTQGIEVDLHSGSIKGRFHCSAGRHLYGHACFSADGRFLFTTESDIKRGEGCIAVRDTTTWQLLAEWSSGGIGPHELCLLPDGKTLVVANGGILTHPDQGRKKLNLNTMQSTLTYLDMANGKLLGDFVVPEPKASIRHLSISDDGAVVFATQVQRSVAGHEKVVALGGVHRPGEAIAMFDSPATVIGKMNDYMGSVAVCSQSRVAGFTSPRGDLAAFWHIDDGRFVGYHALRDVCGIGVDKAQNRFVLSNSFGHMRELDAVTLAEYPERRIQAGGFRWDNHLLVLDAV